MDVKTFADQLQHRIKEQVESITGEQADAVTATGRVIQVFWESLYELKEFTRIYRFADQQEEIMFFKEIKPEIASQYFYYVKLLSIRVADAYGNPESRKAHYRKVLRKLERYLRKHIEFYRYCISGDARFDTLYFTRKGSVSVTSSIDADERFSTRYDTTLSRLLANELLKQYLKDGLQKLDQAPGTPSLTWTGSKTDLIELIYALHSIDAFNSGTADIRLIATSLENVFNVRLGNYYRVFQDIRLRKKGKADFLDRMKKTFIEKVAFYKE